MRPRDNNLNLAVSNENGWRFLRVPDHLPLSTMNAVVAEEIRQSGGVLEERPIQVQTLSAALTEHGVEDIDFLKVDVEGHEMEVLSGNDWARFRPTVLVIESTHPRTVRGEHEKWEEIILEANYLFATFDGLNRYYLKQEASEYLEELSRPLSVFDKHVSFRQFAQIRFLRDGANPGYHRSVDSFRLTGSA